MSDPSKCQHHPDRPAAAQCQKYGRGLCAQCLEDDPRCPDPGLYCKFRQQCIIFHQYKERARQTRQENDNG